MSSQESLFETGSGATPRPLADRMRPASIDEVVGQRHLLGRGAAFREALENGALGSLLLWGPPGSGKTTLALLVSGFTGEHFVRFSAVTGGVADIRRIVAEARSRRSDGEGTLLFVDEIHRFNKAQQDAFLPHVEDGTVRLVGATTQNPSFEINPPLLSRCTVYTLERLEPGDIAVILERALSDSRGIEARGRAPDGEAIALISRMADGDARRALNMLEFLIASAGDREIDAATAGRLLGSSPLLYDRDGEQHYNLMSAFHKSLRSHDVDASLYWLARMIGSGEDPLYIARRMIRFASEDIGLADPSALTVAMRAADAYRFLGPPEGDLALAEAACYLALAPPSNSVYLAWKSAVEVVEREGSLPVPLHLRNAPTGLMRELGYGRGYLYAHDTGGDPVTHSNFPEGMREERLYLPGGSGREAALAERLERWLADRERLRKRRISREQRAEEGGETDDRV